MTCAATASSVSLVSTSPDGLSPHRHPGITEVVMFDVSSRQRSTTVVTYRRTYHDVRWDVANNFHCSRRLAGPGGGPAHGQSLALRSGGGPDHDSEVCVERQ